MVTPESRNSVSYSDDKKRSTDAPEQIHLFKYLRNLPNKKRQKKLRGKISAFILNLLSKPINY
ncbi:MAG: hypothetical protein ACR5LA_07975 [Wolbachia sp.]